MTNYKVMTNEEINARIEELNNKIWWLEVGTDYMTHREHMQYIDYLNERATLRRELRERGE